ncbi:MAG: hypothetical protein MK214_04495 [Thalassotalea sp.]|nr:hypothetical protein [Thalassotalea sp.]
MHQLKKKVLTAASVLIMSGCASSADLERHANHHAKARDYYESIGQPEEARQEAKAANKAWEDASCLLPLLIDLFSLSKDK